MMQILSARIPSLSLQDISTAFFENVRSRSRASTLVWAIRSSTCIDFIMSSSHATVVFSLSADVDALSAGRLEVFRGGELGLRLPPPWTCPQYKRISTVWQTVFPELRQSQSCVHGYMSRTATMIKVLHAKSTCDYHHVNMHESTRKDLRAILCKECPKVVV